MLIKYRSDSCHEITPSGRYAELQTRKEPRRASVSMQLKTSSQFTVVIRAAIKECSKANQRLDGRKEEHVKVEARARGPNEQASASTLHVISVRSAHRAAMR